MPFIKKQLEDYIGRGITLPIKLVNGSVPLDTGVELIKASIRTILSWPYGTRFFLPEFGSRLDELIEEPNDDVLFSLIETFVQDAIEKWEPRIELKLPVNVSRDDYGKVQVQLEFNIISSQKIDSMVFPFYDLINT